MTGCGGGAGVGGGPSPTPVVTPTGASTYTVTVSGVAGNGTLGLNFVDDGSIHDLAGNTLTATDGDGNVTTYTWDGNQLVSRVLKDSALWLAACTIVGSRRIPKL